MRKITHTLILTTLSTFLLVSCGNNQEGNQEVTKISDIQIINSSNNSVENNSSDKQFDEEYLKRREEGREYRRKIMESSGGFGKKASQNPEMFTTGMKIKANPNYDEDAAPDPTIDQYYNTGK